MNLCRDMFQRAQLASAQHYTQTTTSDATPKKAKTAAAKEKTAAAKEKTAAAKERDNVEDVEEEDEVVVRSPKKRYQWLYERKKILQVEADERIKGSEDAPSSEKDITDNMRKKAEERRAVKEERKEKAASFAQSESTYKQSMSNAVGTIISRKQQKTKRSSPTSMNQ